MRAAYSTHYGTGQRMANLGDGWAGVGAGGKVERATYFPTELSPQSAEFTGRGENKTQFIGNKYKFDYLTLHTSHARGEVGCGSAHG